MQIFSLLDNQVKTIKFLHKILLKIHNFSQQKKKILVRYNTDVENIYILFKLEDTICIQ